MILTPFSLIVAVIANVILSVIVGAVAARDAARARSGIAWFFVSLFLTPIFGCLFLIIFTLQDNGMNVVETVQVQSRPSGSATKKIECWSCGHQFSAQFGGSFLVGGRTNCPRCGKEISDKTVKFAD